MSANRLKIGMAQFAPVWLNKEKSIEKICTILTNAAEKECELVAFGEAFLPGYPFWLSFTNGAEFDSSIQKEIHAHYVINAIEIEKGDLKPICEIARKNKMAIYIGFMERALNRGGHSLYCSLAYINQNGEVQSVHRKLQPTYEERLSWSPGDGNGLCVHSLKNFRLGGLNCWENWMPLSRTALYGQGENVHIAVWPGSLENTKDITRFIARESRSYVISVSSILRKTDISTDLPHGKLIYDKAPEILANGGSCIAGPNGEWIIPPLCDKEELIISEIDFMRILEERQNFDVVGHYSRPDVTKLIVNRERQSIIEIED
ncbi:MAG: carbon-nitrogen hydrolase family protein [Bacteroidota bacterium]